MMDATIKKIAAKHLFVETLETRNRDCLDFHDCAIWGIKKALEEAYKAGQKDAAK